MVEKPLSEEQRKQVFLALVDAQDHDMSVMQSRQHIAARYDVSEAQVRRIEREGLDNQYHLVVDMVDEQQCSFSETGSDLLRWELEIREQEVHLEQP